MKKGKDRTNYPEIINSLSFRMLMFQVILADLIFLPLVVLFVAKFGHRQEEPEWIQINRMRAYMRSEEFRRKQKALETEMFKEVISR